MQQNDPTVYTAEMNQIIFKKYQQHEYPKATKTLVIIAALVYKLLYFLPIAVVRYPRL